MNWPCMIPVTIYSVVLTLQKPQALSNMHENVNNLLAYLISKLLYSQWGNEVELSFPILMPHLRPQMGSAGTSYVFIRIVQKIKVPFD